MTEPTPIDTRAQDPADPPAAEPGPRIILTFVGPGMADFSIQASDSLEPAQLYAAAFVVQSWAQETRAAVELERARQAALKRSALVVPANREQRRHGPA